MIKILIIFVLIGFSFGLFADAYAQLPTPTPTVTFSTFTNDYFSIKYPSHWYVNDEAVFYDDGLAVYVWFTPKFEDYDSYIEVSKFTDDTEYHGLSDQQYRTKLATDYENSCNESTFENSGYICTDFSLIDTESIVDDAGNKWHLITYTEEEKFDDGTGGIYFIITADMPSGKDTWTIFSIFDQSFVMQKENTSEIIADVIKSFSVTSPPSSTPQPTLENNVDPPDLFSVSGLMIGMAGNFVMLYAVFILSMRVWKAGRVSIIPDVGFILGEIRKDKKIQKLIIIAIGLYVAGFTIQLAILPLWG